MSAITLRNVVKRYGAVQVVHGVDLTIDEGEFVVLLGPSGCGKTTTLRMVAGLEDVSEGELSIGGRVVNNLAPKDRGVAMVFQNYALYPHMTVRQNMEFALRPMKLEKSVVDKRIADTAEILGLSPLMERRPAQLSGGQRQRVAMGRAMVRTPKVFLFDEPLSNLDAKLRTQVRWEIGKLHQRLGTTVLYVTHDQVEAMTLADKIVIMRDGYVEQVGTPEEVFAHPKTTFVATFIGSPAMNMIDGRIESGRMVAEGISFAIPARYHVSEGQAVTLGIRPSEIKIAASDDAGALDARVEVTEYLGNEALLDLRIGRHEMVAEVPAADRVEPGRTIRVRFNEAALHLFDAQTGKTLAL
ncbi:sn-glycerol-3-phosphate ABC transporter ATP-binding protein UgpC [Defluviimonas sp. WL0002]|uniref:Sn-glycerol-3-phosphate ABC transporter ATP-binding protein UgpC n=1 Tax=Albidovulum marisflavi TaxID=2984159 RepID=A0ABT2ZGT3_9RHOB|nr:sn-glycerol-3-phosphate ABC transporter ATP-binding protein UgpC [Defluviimonas sp. WL0002]MCV2870335.1 sn-glycerol-3-phosphate ABC transporter ATP-binding protein UgpC [Defluviimonas sp. WL0002]